MNRAFIAMLLATSIIFAGCTSKDVNDGNNNLSNTSTSQSENKTNNSSVGENVNIDTKVTTAEEAMKLLEDGNARFLNDKSELRNIDSARRNELKDGQSPYAVIVSCSDSRVTPTTIFNAGLGEIFDIRIAGNVVDDDALGSIEYGAEHLHSPLIVVIGHESCGAVTATYNSVVKGEKATGHIEDIVEKIEPNVNSNGTIDDAIRANIDSVVKQISEDEIIKNLISEGKVKVVGAYYDLNGKVTFNK